MRHAFCVVLVGWLAGCSNTARQDPGSSQPTGPDVADSGNTPGPATGAPGSGPPTIAPCVADPAGTGTLLDPCATEIYSVSPLGDAVLTNHQPFIFHGLDLFLVTRDSVTRVGPEGPYASGRFSADGLSIVFGVADPGQATDLRIARRDGSGGRVLAAPPFASVTAGRWLYYTDQSDGAASLHRVEGVDGAPALIASLPPGSSGVGTQIAVSPDGESVLYCGFDSVCNLRRADGVTFRAPDAGSVVPAWAPDGAHVWTTGCQVMDLAGTVVDLPGCTAAEPWHRAWSSSGRLVATFTSDVRVLDLSTGEVTTLPMPSPVDSSVFRPRKEISFTPDSRHVVVVAGHSSFTAPVTGGAWTMISPDHGVASLGDSEIPPSSPDGRIVADASLYGLALSIDGAPPRIVRAPDGEDVRWLSFERPGGLGRAAFRTRSGKLWLASADGSRDWTFVAADSDGCEWVGRTALCAVGDRITAVPDDASQIVPLAPRAPWSVVAGHLFYVAPRGGLFVIDDLPQPAR